MCPGSSDLLKERADVYEIIGDHKNSVNDRKV